MNLPSLNFFENIPPIWKRAYLLLCLWYAINYAVGTFIYWRLENPADYVWWNALNLFEALCVLIILIFFYSNWLFNFNIYLQIAGHVLGVMIHFVIMGSLSYYLVDYVEGFVGMDAWKHHLVSLLKWEGLHFHDQYIVVIGVYYVIRYFQGLQKEETEKSELSIKNK